MVYLHQSSTKSALSGVNPTSNRNIIICYDLPTFIYGLDTIPINLTDLDRLEIKFRTVLRNMQSLPSSVATPAIYLSMGVLPAVAERDLNILGLLGQLSQCPRDLQSVSDIIEDGLVRFDINFPGWSGLVRRTAAVYGLLDPLDLMEQPWRPDRWRQHCKKEIVKYWIDVLHKACIPLSTLDLFDTSRLLLKSPHPIWVASSCDSISTTRATYVMWLLLGVYNTGKRLFDMKKARSPACLLCGNILDNRVHFMLSCSALSNIRNDFLNQLMALSPILTKYSNASSEFLLYILDPFSPRVPQELRKSWISAEKVYNVSRNFCYAMHKKRTKLLESLHNTNII